MEKIDIDIEDGVTVEVPWFIVATSVVIIISIIFMVGFSIGVYSVKDNRECKETKLVIENLALLPPPVYYIPNRKNKEGLNMVKLI